VKTKGVRGQKGTEVDLWQWIGGSGTEKVNDALLRSSGRLFQLMPSVTASSVGAADVTAGCGGGVMLLPW